MSTKKAARKAPSAGARKRGARSRRRRPPAWYRRPATWVWLGSVALAGALSAVLMLSGSEQQSAGSAGPPYVGGDLHSLVVDPEDPSRLFVGGHDAVAVSMNGGSEWRQVDSLQRADAMGWAFGQDAILVGGHPGISRSIDGGKTFQQVNQGLPSTDVHALGTGAGVIYAASPQVGLFTSTDGGASWQIRTDAAGQSFMGRILVDPVDPDHVIAPDLQAGAVESVDGGRTWRPLGGPEVAMWVSWDPADTDRIVASGVAGAALTEDGGRTWHRINVPPGSLLVELVPGRSSQMYAAALESGTAMISKSSDGGATWTEM